MAVNPEIKKKTEKIRYTAPASEVRESIADGMDLTSEEANETRKIADSTENRQTKVETDFKALQQEYTENGNGAQSSAEITLARDGEPVLADRLDRDFGNISTQLSQIQYLATELGVKVDGTDSTTELQSAIDFVAKNGGTLKLPDKPIVVSEKITIPLENVEAFRIIAATNQKTVLRSKVVSDYTIEVLGPSESGSSKNSRRIDINNIYIEPYDESFRYKIGGFCVHHSIGNTYKDIYVRESKQGIVLKNTVENKQRGFTEQNVFINCATSWCDEGWVFDGIDNNSSFHGNQFINCTASIGNLEISKGWSRDFNQIALAFNKGFIYNCTFDFRVFIQNGATLMHIGCNGGYNFSKITYENFKAWGDDKYTLLPAKITTPTTGDSRLRLSGDIIGIGSDYHTFDLSDYHLTDNGSERLILDSFTRIFRAAGIERNNVENSIYPYDAVLEKNRDNGGKTGFYRYHSTKDYAQETGLIAVIRGVNGRFIISNQKNNTKPEDMEAVFEFDTRYRMHANGHRLDFEGKTPMLNDAEILTSKDFTTGIQNFETGNSASVYKTTVYHGLGVVPKVVQTTVMGRPNSNLSYATTDNYTSTTFDIYIEQTDTNFRSLKLAWSAFSR